MTAELVLHVLAGMTFTGALSLPVPQFPHSFISHLSLEVNLPLVDIRRGSN